MLSRIQKLNDVLADWIPPRNTWTPADEALYKPVDLFRVPLGEAQELQLKAIRYAFTRHYTHNKFYHNYCEAENVRPDDIKTSDDLDKIPLIPDTAYKQQASWKEMAHWIANLYTGDLPRIVIKGTNPTFDDVSTAFKAAGITILHSSGTSGKMTVIPKDTKTFKAIQYSGAKGCANLCYDAFVDHALMAIPNPARSGLAISLGMDVMVNQAKKTHYLFDIDMNAELTQRSMSGNAKPTDAAPSPAQGEVLKRVVARLVRCLEYINKTEETFFIASAPFMLLNMMSVLQKEGKSFDFGERGLIMTGGGWKMGGDARISNGGFRRQVTEVLGIPETHCCDCYSASEINAVLFECPEGHYRHVPHTHCKALVIDESFTPVGYGESGRFAFLDALAHSYPGFVVLGDEVRMLEHCPVCDRPGPVLESKIERAKGEEVRGCAEEVRRVISDTLASNANDAGFLE